jgi:GGDEF domain-containing protein
VSSKPKKPPKGGGLLQSLSLKFDQLLSRHEEPPEAEPKPATMAGDVPETVTGAFDRIERILALDGAPDVGRAAPEGPWTDVLLDFLLNITGLSLGFLTTTLPANSKRYEIMAERPQGLGLERLQTVGSGIAGFVHSKVKPLMLDSLNLDQNVSFLFHQGDGLGQATSFYGWPLVRHQVFRGALMLAGTRGAVLDQAQTAFLGAVANRLAAHLQLGRLAVMAAEQDQLDPQTGLPHRAVFVERLGALLRQSPGSILWLLCVSGLGHFSVGHGQPEASALLRALAQQLMSDARPGWEIGHLSYGVFTVAAPADERLAVDNAILSFQKRLNDWPLPPKAVRVFFVFHQAVVRHPQDGEGPEALLEAALNKLAQSD